MNYEQYPDYRAKDAQEQEWYEHEKLNYTNSNGTLCWLVYGVEDRKSYKIISIKNIKGFSPINVIIYPEHPEYENTKVGNLIDGFYRNINGSQYFTDWKRPERLLAVGESFTDAENNITAK